MRNIKAEVYTIVVTINDTRSQSVDSGTTYGKVKSTMVFRGRHWLPRLNGNPYGGESACRMEFSGIAAEAGEREMWLPDVVLCDPPAVLIDAAVLSGGAVATPVTLKKSPIHRLGCFLGFAVSDSALRGFREQPAR